MTESIDMTESEQIELAHAMLDNAGITRYAWLEGLIVGLVIGVVGIVLVWVL